MAAIVTLDSRRPKANARLVAAAMDAKADADGIATVLEELSRYFFVNAQPWPLKKLSRAIGYCRTLSESARVVAGIAEGLDSPDGVA